jgi:imidazolonepropionase
MATVIRGIGRLFTATARGTVERAALVVDHGLIAWVGGPDESPPAELAAGADEVDAEGGLVTPGLIDAHVHPVYAGNRFAEIARRSAGASYAEIGRLGGGIAATVAATRAAGIDRLRADLRARLGQWLASGTTTMEVKTGYALDRDGEVAHVRLLADLADDPELPRLAVTFLGAHAVPPEYAGRQAAYAAEVARWCRPAAEAGARFVDVFCDEGYFSVEEARAICLAGRAAGLTPRLHADELARTGGALLAAELGAASADHLLRIDAEDARALAAAGVVAVLAPGTALAMGAAPPARALLDAGATLALGTDHNPGTCGLTRMSLVVALAIAGLSMSVDEALVAATAGGAAALRRGDVGVVAPGRLADLVLWDADHEGAFAWAYGLAPRRVWRGGVEVAAVVGAVDQAPVSG